MQKVSLVLRHFNKIKPIICTVKSGDLNKLFTIKLDENENTGADMIKGDPILIGMLNSNDSIQINGGIVVGATPQEDEYIICTNKVIDIAKELDQRQYERYPVSLLGDIKVMDGNIRESAYIKDISYSGMCIYSTGDFGPEDTVEVSIYLSNTVSKYDGTIVRKEINFGRNEYGIQIIHRDKITMDAVEAQISAFVQSEKELMHRHLLSTRFKI